MLKVVLAAGIFSFFLAKIFEETGDHMTALTPRVQKRDQYFSKILELIDEFSDRNIELDQYKAQFWQVFADAFVSRFCLPKTKIDYDKMRVIRMASPLATADSIFMFAKDSGWLEARLSNGEQHDPHLDQVVIWWREWTYACGHHLPKRKRRST